MNASVSTPIVLLPESDHRSLRAVAWHASNGWQNVAAPLPLRTAIARVTRLGANVQPNGAAVACVNLVDSSWWRVTLSP